MKVDFLRKFKWYIIGFILLAVMLSVSLSFSAWDKLSVKAIFNANSGNYAEKKNTVYKLANADDINKNGIADIGDVVTFGNYYQNADLIDKTPIRWIVVHEESNQLTLLTEKVMAFGNFWGNYYHNGSNWQWGNVDNGRYYQNYAASTLRAWLNSDYHSRNDDGIAFSGGEDVEPRFHGFMSEAFTSEEQSFIIEKIISGIKGYKKDDVNNTNFEYYSVTTDKVWVPSWSEIYGTNLTAWGTTIDGNPSTKFAYFNGVNSGIADEKLIGKATAFAATPSISNYSAINTSHIENAQSVVANQSSWWWLRSPRPSDHRDMLTVNSMGLGNCYGTVHSYGGVRPAVCVPQ